MEEEFDNNQSLVDFFLETLDEIAPPSLLTFEDDLHSRKEWSAVNTRKKKRVGSPTITFGKCGYQEECNVSEELESKLKAKDEECLRMVKQVEELEAALATAKAEIENLKVEHQTMLSKERSERSRLPNQMKKLESQLLQKIEHRPQISQDQQQTIIETCRIFAPDSTNYYPATRILPMSSRAEVTRYKFPKLAETNIEDAMRKIVSAEGAMILEGLFDLNPLVLEELMQIANDSKAHKYFTSSASTRPIKTTSNFSTRDRFQLPINPGGSLKYDKAGNKLLSLLSSNKIPWVSPNWLYSVASGLPQVSHVDLPRNPGGMAFVLALQNGTYLSLHMEYDDHLGCRNEFVELRAGDIIIVAGNQPHAGCSFMTDNVRIHWYDKDPGISQTQGYLFPGSYFQPRFDRSTSTVTNYNEKIRSIDSYSIFFKEWRQKYNLPTSGEVEDK